MTERKELINPSDIKIGDELEVTFKGIFRDIQEVKTNLVGIKYIKVFSGANKYPQDKNVIEFEIPIEPHFTYPITIYRILSAATKLEVGEIVIDDPQECKIIGIDKNKKTVAVQYLIDYRLKIWDYSVFKFSVRKSGIPIDWDATFND